MESQKIIPNETHLMQKGISIIDRKLKINNEITLIGNRNEKMSILLHIRKNFLIGRTIQEWNG